MLICDYADGEWQEETEWFRVVAWGPLAERTAEHGRARNETIWIAIGRKHPEHFPFESS